MITQISSQSTAVSFTDQSQLLVSRSRSGVSIAIADMNGDGKDDLITLDQGKYLNIDYQTSPNNTFQHLGSPIISNDPQWAMAVADYDNNGLNDIVVGGDFDNVKVIVNINGEDSVGLFNINNSSIFMQGTNFVDIDQDGYVDIFACNDNGDNRPFRNNTNGGFIYAPYLINTETTPKSDNSGNYSSAWVDYDNDGDLDMYISKCRAGVDDPNDPRRINRLFQNDGNNQFTDVAEKANMKIGAQSWCTDFADIDNDGDMDAFVANHYDDCQLMLNQGDGTFRDVTANSGLFPYVAAASGSFAIQTMFKDFNNDGFVDLLFTGNKHFLFINNGDGSFRKAAELFGNTQIESCAVGDLNQDGFLDIYAGYAELFNKPSNIQDRLFFNNGNSNNFIAIQLEGVESNINGIGARIEIYGAWGKQIREVRSGESYGVMNSLNQYFGLGNANSVDKIIVKWPLGIVQEINNPQINQFLKIKELPSCLGQACNDNDPCTENDAFDEDCQCIGEFTDEDKDGICDLDDICPGFNDNLDSDNDGIPDGCDDCDAALIGTSCDDGNDCTINDVYNTACACVGELIDSDNDGICDANDPCPNFNNNLIGLACDDGNNCTSGETWDSNCDCTGGQYIDADADGTCANEDPNDNDPCVPNANAANCMTTTSAEMDCQLISHATFENGNLGTWVDGGYAARIIVGTNYANNGSHAFIIQDNEGLNSSLWTKEQNLSFYTQLDLSFSLLANSVENGDRFIIEFANYGNYETQAVFTTGQEFLNNVRTDISVSIRGTFSETSSIRIRSLANSASDNFIFDDIILEGCIEPITTNCVVGAPCEDGDPCTEGETLDSDCRCRGGVFTDSDNDNVCDANDVCPGKDDKIIGQLCDDGDHCTVGSRYDNDCGCSGGIYVDADNDGVCIGDDANDNDPCIPNISNASCDDNAEEYDCQEIAFSDFENGEMGIWRDGGSYATIFEATSFANSGDFSFYIHGNYDGASSLYSYGINLGAYNALVLQFHFYAYGMEQNDKFHVEIGTAGNYQTVKTYTQGVDFLTNEKRNVTLIIDDYNLNASSRIRFRCEGNTTTDYVILDDILLQGCLNDETCISGTSCDDGDDCTAGEYYDQDCNCIGGLTVDADGDGYCLSLDPDDDDPCIPDANSPACDTTTPEDDCILISTADFENSQLGIWNLGGKAAQLLHTSSFANSGKYIVYLYGDDGITSSLYSDELDLLDFEKVKIAFNLYAHKTEAGDKFSIDIATNGVYQTVYTFTEGIHFTNEVRKNVEVVIPGNNLTSTTSIRFRSQTSDNDDFIMLDDIIVEKCKADSFDAPTISLRQNPNQTNLTTLDEITVYPNPASDWLKVNCPSASEDQLELEVYNTQGQKIAQYKMSSGLNEIDLTSWLSNQLYLLRIKDSNKNYRTFKLFKN